MFRLIDVQALPDYRLRLRYDNGVEGEVNLSDLAGRGVFKAWDDYRNFEHVTIGESGQVAWGNEIDLCPDALYLRLTGKAPKDVFPALKEMRVDA